MNQRNTEQNVDKHNEALKVLPKLFSDNGYQVTYFDPPWANYNWTPDLSIFDDLENVHAYNTIGNFVDMGATMNSKEDMLRNFFCFGLTKALPVVVQPLTYDYANYNRNRELDGDGYRGQVISNAHTADGISLSFMNSYEVLVSMDDLTQVTQDGTNNLFIMRNLLPHEPALLQEPDYTPSWKVDNTLYDATHENRFTVDGVTLKMESYLHYRCYQTNMAAMLQVASWLDYLRENDVYDNTRIIICSDHGYGMGQLDSLIIDNTQSTCIDAQQMLSLLMVKDFGETGQVQTSREFMTAADVPTLSTDGLISNPVNPYTGNLISNAEKNAHPQYLHWTFDWDAALNNGTTFKPGIWLTVEKDAWNTSNWNVLSYSDVLYSEN